MISKGLDFPNVTLVGIINADIGLLYPDFRATEKTFQILTQVSGRSGRSFLEGEVLIQTHHPEYAVFTYVMNHDYLNFYKYEINNRKNAKYPPFCRIALIELKAKNKILCESKIKELFNVIKSQDTKNILEILPPGPPLFSKLKDMYRFHLLIKSFKTNDISGRYLINSLNIAKDYSEQNFPSTVRMTIDMDAIDML
jgi:primosomal protein N' (replication factor Y)